MNSTSISNNIDPQTRSYFRSSVDNASSSINAAAKGTRRLADGGFEKVKTASNKTASTLTSVLEGLKVRVTTDRQYAPNALIKGSAIGAAVCALSFAALRYSDVAIEAFKGLLLNDLLLFGAYGLVAATVIMLTLRLFNVGPVTNVADAANPSINNGASASDTLNDVQDKAEDIAQGAKGKAKEAADAVESEVKAA